MENMEGEKRRFVRVEEPVCAWLQFRRDGAAYGTLTIDVGLEGARFTSLRQVRIGDHLMVSLQLPSMTIECKGKVCWSSLDDLDTLCFGVRFLDLREAEREHLNRYLSKVAMAQVAPA